MRPPEPYYRGYNPHIVNKPAVEIDEGLATYINAFPKGVRKRSLRNFAKH